jgi:hypothetical protein
VLKKSPKTGKEPIRFEVVTKKSNKNKAKIYPSTDEMAIFDFFNTIGEVRPGSGEASE